MRELELKMGMKRISIFMSFSTFLFLLLITISFPPQAIAAEHQNAGTKNRVYIVYMGSPDSWSKDDARLVTSFLRGKRNAVVHTYKHGFSGFAARLSEEEAHSIAQNPRVVSIFPDPLLKLHTTHSWDFLKYQTALEIDSNLQAAAAASASSVNDDNGSDTIIGFLDTGIWPESESFSDKDMGPIPSRWKGTCMKGHDFSSSNCNRKLIGARFYDNSEFDSQEPEEDSPRDSLGHGSHVAGTAAGGIVPGASFYGVADGTAKGGSPGSRIAAYKVCSKEGCLGSSILAAFDDAVADGVDILSLSLGSPTMFEPELSEDPIAIGAFHAVEHGIMVVCSAGNDGPSPQTVVNVAPWILTVAASTIDRDFESDVVLGTNKVIKGRGINFSRLQKSPAYPLIYARNCDLNSTMAEKIKGKIVVCDARDDNFSWNEQLDAVKSLGGVAVIFQKKQPGVVAETYSELPATVISSKEGLDILSYINSTRNPVATILSTVTVMKYQPAPTVVYFSSRGPAHGTTNILKPDVAAPGVSILAPWMGNDTDLALAGNEPPQFNVISGTSMACPHVSGIAATVKAQNPTWSPSAIRSAIITTATQTNNLGAPITTDSNSIATPYDYGAGEVTTTGPLQPGLVYETDTIDYLNYLCYYGLSTSKIKTISRTAPKEFACPKDSNDEHISNINYPSIAISKFTGKESKNVSRKVTNVAGDGEMVFTATVDAPTGLSVQVIPDKLQFSKNNQKLSYQVVFSPTTSSPKEDMFGSLTWTNGKYKVRSPFVVSI